MKRTGLMIIVLFIVISTVMSQEEVGLIDAPSVGRVITIDGDMSDWDGIEPAYIDTIGDNEGSVFDFSAAYIANDNDYLYMRILFAEPAPFAAEAAKVNIIFNADFDPSTGYGYSFFAGSEFFIQAGGVYDHRSGANFVDVFEQNADNNWGAFATAEMGFFEEPQEVEISLRRDLTYSDDENGMPGLLNPDDAPIFEFPDFIVVFEAETPEWSAVEFMPNVDPAGGDTGLIYEFAEGPVNIHSWPLY